MVIFGPCPLVGPLFCAAPVRPNMLNMPKSASGNTTVASFTCLLLHSDWSSPFSTLNFPIFWAIEYYFVGATVLTIRTVLRLTPPQVSPTFNCRPRALPSDDSGPGDRPVFEMVNNKTFRNMKLAATCGHAWGALQRRPGGPSGHGPPKILVEWSTMHLAPPRACIVVISGTVNF